MSKRFPNGGEKKSNKKRSGWMKDYPDFIEEDTEKLLDLDYSIMEGRKMLKEIRRKMGRKKEHWASQCFSCPIRVVNEWRSVEATNDEGITTYKIFATGDSIEDDVIDRYKTKGCVLDEQFPVWIEPEELKYRISGLVDIVVMDVQFETYMDFDEELGEERVFEGVTETIMPIEVKSAKDFSEKYGYDGWKKYLPRKEHIAQLMTYLKSMGLDVGWVHYINKNRQLDGRYLVKVLEEFWLDMIKYFAGIEELVEQDKDALEILDVKEYFADRPPYGERKKDTFPCIWFSSAKDFDEPTGYCQYYDRCLAALKDVKK